MHFCSYPHEFDLLPPEVREALEAESYAAFMGSPSDADPVTIANTPSVPQPLADTTRRLIATASFSSYTHGNHRLSERLAHEAVSWCNSQWSRLKTGDPLEGETVQLEALERSASIAAARGNLPPESRRRVRQLAETLLVEAQATRWPDAVRRIEARARIAVVARAWRTAVSRDRERSQTRELGRALGQFVRDMGEVIPRLSRAQSVVQDLFGSEDSLWDQSPGAWLDAGWDSLEQYAKVLAAHPELDHLAEILGRSRAATEVRTTTTVLRDVKRVPVGLGKSEVTGVNFGDDLSSLLPSEVALLANPETEDLFYAKLAHKELLVLDYRREKLVDHVRLRSVAATERVTIPRGPIIMCVDTSGSMLGEPERVAKATTLALARRLTADRRPIHVIAFSTAIRSFTLSGSPDLQALCGFLGGSFHGGTDLRPALAEALNTLETRRFENADVLVISDFRIPKIADRFIEQIKRAQHGGTLFHSLTIARAPVRDPLHIFDNSWLFDISSGMRGIKPDTLRFLG